MPIAEKFKALGVGNGFPFCLEKVDVSNFHYKEPLTLTEAANFWWNIYSIEATATISVTHPPEFEMSDYEASAENVTIENDLYNGVEQYLGQIGDREPSKRIDLSSSSFKGINKKSDVDNSEYYGCSVSITTSRIFKMYNGSTGNESNFNDEYGIGTFDVDGYMEKPFAEAAAGSDGGEIGATCQLLSVAPSLADSGDWRSSILGVPNTVESVTLNGIPLLKAVWNTWDDVGSQGGATQTTTADISGLNFYTYPG